MELLFDLLLTAFFSLLFAFLLSKLFSPSPHGDADVITPGAQETGSPPSRRGEELQEEKIIEVDKVVEKEAERGFLAEEERSELGESVGVGYGKVAICEEIEERSDDFASEVEFEKEKCDRGFGEKFRSFELETSIDFDKEKELCASQVGDGKVAEISNLISVQDVNLVRKEERLGEVTLSEPEGEEDDRDNLCKVEGSKSKMAMVVGAPTEEETQLKEEHEFKIDSRGSLIVQMEISQVDENNDLCEAEGSICKTASNNETHLKESIVPEAISVETIESRKLAKGEGEENISKVEGPPSKTTQLVGVGGKEEKEKAFTEEEEDWEGIERTDVEKRFAVAAGYATSACGADALSKLSSEVQLQLYGLHKVATEGPCYESHPLALRASTRAKWHAWQKLGNMNPDTAMQQYMTLLSENLPGFVEQPIVDIEHKESDLTTESGSCIEGPIVFGSAVPEKGTESNASIQ